MYADGPEGLTIAAATTDDDLRAMIAVRTAANPDRPAPRLENLRHNMTAQRGLTFLVARLSGEPVACGFVYGDIPASHAEAHVVVRPDVRRLGVGSALLAEAGARARGGGKLELEGPVREDDHASRAFLERRGFRVVGGEQALALDLSDVDPLAPTTPSAVEIVSRAARPDLTDALYPVGAEGAEDIPGFPGRPTYEQWRATDIDRPTRIPELFFIALVDGEPIGYAAMDDYGRDAFHGLTAVRRSWRRRGVATALKLTQIAAAKERGFRRVFTTSEERNAPMRALNAKLGYRPEPSLSELVLRGPADVRLPHGDN